MLLVSNRSLIARKGFFMPSSSQHRSSRATPQSSRKRGIGGRMRQVYAEDYPSVIRYNQSIDRQIALISREAPILPDYSVVSERSDAVG